MKEGGNSKEYPPGITKPHGDGQTYRTLRAQTGFALPVFCSTIIALLCLWAMPAKARAETILEAAQAVEREIGGRVGFYFHDQQTGQTIEYAHLERFPLNSTFKLLACAALLLQVDEGKSRLSETVLLDGLKVVPYSPAIKQEMAAGHLAITLSEACRMMLSVSDNTAANIILAEIGGPAGLTAHLRSLGDTTTRIDRWEPELNEALPGDLRDTTTPKAVAQTMEMLLLGNRLSASTRAVLRNWLAGHAVADELFRKVLPNDWSIEDRTGAGGHGSRSIIAIIYPPGRKPVIATLFLTQNSAAFSARNSAIARVGAAIVKHIRAN